MQSPFPSPTPTWHTTTYPSISPTRPELSAKGKTVLITGGGTGIGAETARAFACAGASRIALLGRREQPLLETKASISLQFPTVEIFTAVTDVTKKHDVDAAFAAFLRDGKGKLDVLISNAAVTGPMEAVAEVEPSLFLDAITTNLAGAILIAQAFLRYKAPDAVAIETSSSAAHLNFLPGFAAYSVSKMGVFRLWDSLAFAEKENGVRVYHVQPGVVDTEMNREAGGAKAVGHRDHVSLPASFNVWLASPEAGFLRGKFLWANWDVDELMAEAGEIEESQRLNIGLGGWPFGREGWTPAWKS